MVRYEQLSFANLDGKVNMSAKTSPDHGAGKDGQRRIRGTRFTADWATVDSEKIKAAIAAASSNGGALRFGYTRDGGAYALGILGDGDPYTIYCGSSDDIHKTLDEIRETFE